MSGNDAATVGRPFPVRLALAILLPGPIAGIVAALGFGLTMGADLVFTQTTEDYAQVPATQQHIASMLAFLVVAGAFQGAIYGSLAMLILGLPAHEILLKRTTARAWLYTLTGLIAGAIFGALFAAPALLTSPTDMSPAILLSLGVIAGATAAAIFWLIRRPDRDALAGVARTHEKEDPQP